MKSVSHFFLLLRLLTFIALVSGSASPALAADPDGTVTDPRTGLQWMRCAMGQAWDRTTCAGNAATYAWDQANALTGATSFAGYNDWRLPNIRELQTLVDRSRVDPAIDALVFPNTPSSYFWSASASAYYSLGAWSVDFINGRAYDYSRGGAFQVRLVRAGQSLTTLDARPSFFYEDHGDGTATYTPTGLMWKRCAEGQAWSGTTCIGIASTYTWNNAMTLASSFAGETDWRLPTEVELISLVDYTRHSPAINQSIFPATSPWNFWSASVNAGHSGSAWNVYFVNGGDYIDGKDFASMVRLVRAGQPLGTFSLSVNTTGSGAVTGSALSGINCGTVCAANYIGGTTVTLTATPASNLIAWGGACSGNSPTCTITMDSAKSVSASFLNTPLASGLPTSITFQRQNIGSTSVTQSAVLSNTGTATLTLGSILASGDFGVSHNCGGGLAAGGSCTLNISFTPIAVDTRTGSVTFTSNAPGSPHSIALNGVGQGGAVSLSASALVFADQMQGATSAPLSFTVSNPGGAVLNIASIVANGDFSRTTTCGSSLAQGANCSIDVRFMPITVGSRTGTVVITSDALDSPHTVTLSGTGLAAPMVSLNPTALSFTEQRVGTTSAAQAITLSNTGAAALDISSVIGSGDFTVSHNCGTGLGVGGFCDLTVHFKPRAGGTRTGTITINSNAAASPHTASLSGQGKAAGLTPILMLLLE